ncbi:MAG: AbrB/MazE/SpoVT family DNA-binding domain-containing protein [Ignavibacteriae bacterium]|nr:AbrB/MazE/SpoVT family DNA-binding domain-containing protein [Ignavibacteriota bacterium]NOG96381.1 AbrB/MazE/SpoVT family DNA-binding domain-containing protein [Ignavibacteriota bacterium]
MTALKILPRFQVVIPKAIRKRLKLKPGQQLQIVELGDRIEFLIMKNIKEARGYLKEMDTAIAREDRI